MRTGSFKKLSGEIEADETYLGGKEQFKHRNHIPSSFWVHGHQGKTAVLGILERGGDVRATVVASAKRKELEPHIIENIELGSTLYTDQLQSYVNIAKDRYEHFSVNHMEKYVDGKIHTNGLENFWCLLKRAVKGTYTQVAPFHVDRYLDEEVFRFNHRKKSDFGRFEQAVSQMFGKILTYTELTGTAT
jgi:transposase-like protein